MGTWYDCGHINNKHVLRNSLASHWTAYIYIYHRPFYILPINGLKAQRKFKVSYDGQWFSCSFSFLLLTSPPSRQSLFLSGLENQEELPLWEVWTALTSKLLWALSYILGILSNSNLVSYYSPALYIYRTFFFGVTHYQFLQLLF